VYTYNYQGRKGGATTRHALCDENFWPRVMKLPLDNARHSSLDGLMPDWGRIKAQRVTRTAKVSQVIGKGAKAPEGVRPCQDIQQVSRKRYCIGLIHAMCDFNEPDPVAHTLREMQ